MEMECHQCHKLNMIKADVNMTSAENHTGVAVYFGNPRLTV